MKVSDAVRLRHVPTVAGKEDGVFRVFCLACFDDTGDRVHPCRAESPLVAACPSLLVSEQLFKQTLSLLERAIEFLDTDNEADWDLERELDSRLTYLKWMVNAELARETEIRAGGL